MAFRHFFIFGILVVCVSADDFKYIPPSVNADTTVYATNNLATPSDNLKPPRSGYNYHQTGQSLTNEQIESSYYPPAKYEFSYDVHNEETGDIKSHTESRDGNLVRGTYSVVEPDGFRRVVTYMADDRNGFNAIVERQPYVLHRISTSVAIKTANTDETPATQQEQAKEDNKHEILVTKQPTNEQTKGEHSLQQTEQLKQQHQQLKQQSQQQETQQPQSLQQQQTQTQQKVEQTQEQQQQQQQPQLPKIQPSIFDHPTIINSVELPIQPRDSYGVPPRQHNDDGPYP